MASTKVETVFKAIRERDIENLHSVGILMIFITCTPLQHDPSVACPRVSSVEEGMFLLRLTQDCAWFATVNSVCKVPLNKLSPEVSELLNVKLPMRDSVLGMPEESIAELGILLNR